MNNERRVVISGGHRPAKGGSPEPQVAGRCHQYGGGPLDDAKRNAERTEVETLARARAGDFDAYEALIARHTPFAHRTAVLLGAGDDAEDVLQEAFVKAYRRLPLYRGDSPFRSWLVAIVANETRNLHRSRRRRDGLVQRAGARELEPVAPDLPADAALSAERRAALLDAIRHLDDRDREVIVCRYLLDLSEAETAQTLGWPLGTVKSRTARALVRLRTWLSAEVRRG